MNKQQKLIVAMVREDINIENSLWSDCRSYYKARKEVRMYMKMKECKAHKVTVKRVNKSGCAFVECVKCASKGIVHKRMIARPVEGIKIGMVYKRMDLIKK